MSIYDVAIIGAGVGGAFSAFKIAKEYKDVKAIIFDIGRPPAKRRRQLEGFLGCLPNSDGKLYINDLNKVSKIIGNKKIKNVYNNFNKIINNVGTFKIIKDKSPSISMEKKLHKNNFDITLNDYMQIYPKNIHALSKYMSDVLEDGGNVTYSFDNEVKKIHKNKNIFTIVCENQEFKCKKVIIAVGRSGWRWARDLYNDFGIIENNDVAKFGIRVEVNSSIMKDFNKSNCTLTKENLEIGPLSWFGTVIPEDHVDLAISAFRSNENRWKSDKVSFSLIGSQNYPNNGFEQTDRIGKLTFILSNDRIIRERISNILNNRSKISIMPEYEWLKQAVGQLSTIIPEISTKAYFHIPTIVPLAPQINLGSNLETEIDGMYVIGESAGISGILSAATMGISVVNEICK